MIQLIVECSGAEPLAFHHFAVTGVRTHVDGRFFQILEGPEGAVLLGLAVLADGADHLARTTIAEPSFPTWRTETVPHGDLPEDVATRVVEFAAATAANSDGPDVHQAIDFLNCLVDTRPMPAVSSGLRPFSKVGGQSGKRAWIAV